MDCPENLQLNESNLFRPNQKFDCDSRPSRRSEGNRGDNKQKRNRVQSKSSSTSCSALLGPEIASKNMSHPFHRTSNGEEMSDFDYINPKFLYCGACDVVLQCSESMFNHLRGKMHKYVMEMLPAHHKRVLECLKSRAAIAILRQDRMLERLVVREKNVKLRYDFCLSCETKYQTDGRIPAKHYDLEAHRVLKDFNHPYCHACSKDEDSPLSDFNFENRYEFEVHRTTASHMRSVQRLSNSSKLDIAEMNHLHEWLFDCPPRSFRNPIDPIKSALYEREKSVKFDGSPNESSIGRKRAKSGGSDDSKKFGGGGPKQKSPCGSLIIHNLAQHELQKFQEAECFSDFGLPSTYDSDVVVGSSFLKRVCQWFCTACQILIEEVDTIKHLKSKTHYDSVVLSTINTVSSLSVDNNVMTDEYERGLNKDIDGSELDVGFVKMDKNVQIRVEQSTPPVTPASIIVEDDMSIENVNNNIVTESKNLYYDDVDVLELNNDSDNDIVDITPINLLR